MINSLDLLANLGSHTGAFKVASMRDHSTGTASLRLPDGKIRRLTLQARDSLIPADALSLVGRDRGADTLLCSRFISPRVAEILAQAKLNYLDAAGNCRIALPGLFLHVEGKPNLYPDTRKARNIFAPQSSRILRLLLEDPAQVWTVKQLSAASRVSMGLVSRIKHVLTDDGYLTNEGGGFRLLNAYRLLLAWAEEYEQPPETRLYVMADAATIEQRLAKICEREKLTYGFNGFSGAWRLAPMVRYNRTSVALLESGGGDVLKMLVQALDAKTVESGSNLALHVVGDEFVFHQKRLVGGVSVLSPLQLFLELKHKAARGTEAADALYDQHIKPAFDRAGMTHDKPS